MMETFLRRCAACSCMHAHLYTHTTLIRSECSCVHISIYTRVHCMRTLHMTYVQYMHRKYIIHIVLILLCIWIYIFQLYHTYVCNIRVHPLQRLTSEQCELVVGGLQLPQTNSYDHMRLKIPGACAVTHLMFSSLTQVPSSPRKIALGNAFRKPSCI